MKIRDAEPTDTDEIRSLHKKAILQLGAESYSKEQLEAWASGCESANYVSVMQQPEIEFIVAEDKNRVQGFGTLSTVAPTGYNCTPDGEITGVYVEPNAVRNRIGSAIYTELESRARKSGIQVLGLKASQNAVPFYISHRYTEVTTHTHEFSQHENTATTGTVVEMKKPL